MPLTLAVAFATALTPLPAALPARLRASPAARTRPAIASAAPPASPAQLSPLFTFAGAGRDAAIAQWERIDDVIMGGVSASRLVAATDADAADFQGTVREQGGGFCGQRLKLLSSPLDLSPADGLYVRCEADAAANRRVWKVAVRTRQDRGEVVYQAAFKPEPGVMSTHLLPWGSFRLVRGARLVEGEPPLSAAAVASVYQISMIVSKFEISAEGRGLTGFAPGRFRLRVEELGAYSTSAAAENPLQLQLPSTPTPTSTTTTTTTTAAPTTPVARVFRFLFSVLASEAKRRRKAAGMTLRSRGLGPLARLRYAYRLRASALGPVAASAAVARTALTDAVSDVFATAVRLMFAVVFRLLRAVGTLRKAVGKATPV